jgi:heme/copper-type cytochrome/quinol oxidase subunit 2
MRFFELLNFQDVVLYLLPAIIFLVVFGTALAYSHFNTRDSEARQEKIYGQYVEGFETKNGPFPLSLILIIIGTVVWAFLYTLIIGLLGVKI